jgi:very-short-patch-repair endonuclease
MAPHHRSLSQGSKSRARALRAAETDAEKALWRVLRDRRLQSTKWRRQVPIGPYIADFVCFEHRLVVECDGSQHGESLHDAKRDEWLHQQGFAVARFWNHEILRQRENVLSTILARCGLPW